MIRGLQALGQVADIKATGQQQQQQSLQQSDQPQPQDVEDLTRLKQHMSDMTKAPSLKPGAWCALVPVFANPYVPCVSLPGITPSGLQELPIPARRGPFYCRGGYVRPLVRTLSELMRSWFVINHAVAAQQPHPLLHGDGSNAEGELDDINALVGEIPPAWTRVTLQLIQQSAAQPSLGQWPPVSLPDPPLIPLAAEQCVEAMLVARLGWRGLPGDRTVSVAGLTVKLATSLQLGPLRAERRERHVAFVQAAIGSNGRAAVDAGYKQLLLTFSKCWKIVWDNKFKEVYWRLTMNGLPTAHRMRLASNACFCGCVCPGFEHHVWDCPMAQAVVQSILAELPPAWCTRIPGSTPLHKKHMWLMQPPPGQKRVYHAVWRIVCLAAINAFDHARKQVNLYHKQQHASLSQPVAQPPVLPPGQRSLDAYITRQPSQEAQQRVQQRDAQQMLERQQQQQQAFVQLLHDTKQQAVARFWELLADWVVLNPAPPPWCERVSSDHPFLCLDAQMGRIRLAPRLAG